MGQGKLTSAQISRPGDSVRFRWRMYGSRPARDASVARVPAPWANDKLLTVHGSFRRSRSGAVGVDLLEERRLRAAVLRFPPTLLRRRPLRGAPRFPSRTDSKKTA